MSSIKDKLTQSVRTARGNPPAAKTASTSRVAAAKPAVRAEAKPAAAPAPCKPAAARAPRAAAPAAGPGGEPPHSGGTLFPQRVWPD